MRRISALITMALIVLLVTALAGCGQKPVTKSTQPKLPKIPDVSEKPKETSTPKVQDYIGYDYQNIPRYPNSTRVKFINDNSGTFIVYSTNYSVQSVANFYVQALPGWQITANSSEEFASRAPTPNSDTNMSIKQDLALGNKTAINIWAYSGWQNLKPDDPSLHTENYNDQPNSKAVRLVMEQQDVAGQDIGNTRPNNTNTKRISYEVPAENDYLIEYLVAEPYELVAIEYVAKGYSITDSEKEKIMLAPSGHVFPRITLKSPPDDYSGYEGLTEIKVESQPGY
jgi:hypothetical protein